jgi:AcrR family transcriptional regulator
LAGKKNKRAQIMTTAVELFAAKGYAATTVREIVSRAGVTKPVLYYYFTSKEGLFQAVMDDAREIQTRIINETLAGGGSAREKLALLFRLIYRAVRRHPHMVRMIQNVAFAPPQGTPPVDIFAFHRSMVDTVRRIYAEGLARGELRPTDPEDAAALVLSLVDFCMHVDYLQQQPPDPQRPLRLLDLAFGGLAADEEIPCDAS